MWLCHIFYENVSKVLVFNTKSLKLVYKLFGVDILRTELKFFNNKNNKFSYTIIRRTRVKKENTREFNNFCLLLLVFILIVSLYLGVYAVF